MKRCHYIGTIMLVLTITAYGQKPELSGLGQETLYRQVNASLAVTGNFRQNPVGKQEKTTIQKLDSVLIQSWNKATGKWVSQGKNLYTYDVWGNNKQKRVFLWNDTTSRWLANACFDYTHDVNGNITVYHILAWDQASGRWKENYRYNYQYDSRNNLTRQIFYDLTDTSGHNALNNRTDYAYDAMNNITQRISYKWQDLSTGEWIPDEKEVITYDTTGNHTLSILTKYDETLNLWNYTSKTEWSWDNEGNLVSFTGFRWNKSSSQWEYENKSDYSYDVDGNNVQTISSSWNISSSQWVYGYKQEFKYDPVGNITEYLTYSWNKTTTKWENYNKSECIYNSVGKLTKETRYTWNKTSGSWIGTYQQEIAYDTDRNRTLYKWNKWNSNTSQWVNQSRKEYSYDVRIPLSEVIFPDSNFLDMINDSVFNKLNNSVFYEWDAISGKPEPDNSNLFFYSGFIVPRDTINAFICDGETYAFSGETLHLSGFYSDTLASVSGNDSIKTLDLTVYPSLQPGVEIRGDTLVSPEPYYAYQWYADAEVIPGATIRTYTISRSGRYHLMVTDDHGCTHTSETITAIHSDAGTTWSGDLTFSVIPNPNTGKFFFRMDRYSRGECILTLANSLGQIIEQRHFNSIDAFHQEPFDISNQGKGIYYLIISNGSYSSGRKIVVQ